MTLQHWLRTAPWTADGSPANVNGTRTLPTSVYTLERTQRPTTCGPIRVLLESHILAAGMVDSSARTGIRRIVADLVQGLVQRPDVRLGVCISDFEAQTDLDAASLLSDYTLKHHSVAPAGVPALRLGALARWAEEHANPGTTSLRETNWGKLKGRPAKLRVVDPMAFYAAQPFERAARALMASEFELRLNLSGVYRTAGFAICPLLGGTGQQVKIVEAMAHGLPVVALAEVAAQSPIIHGVNGLVATDAAEFAEHVRSPWSDRMPCRRLGTAAREIIAGSYSRENLLESLAQQLG